ncbi:hypothetical protein QBC39DRAFT_362632 [Podospora conica]|nr:hypothetical protein QBC39DRAFT_362632 [Schizothecium conicum]
MLLMVHVWLVVCLNLKWVYACLSPSLSLALLPCPSVHRKECPCARHCAKEKRREILVIEIKTEMTKNKKEMYPICVLSCYCCFLLARFICLCDASSPHMFQSMPITTLLLLVCVFHLRSPGCQQRRLQNTNQTRWWGKTTHP